MDVQDSQVWEEVTEKVFDDLGYLLDESGVEVSYTRDFAGPGGDWDIYEVNITGRDSGDKHKLYGYLDNMTGFHDGPDCDLWELTQELAYYISDSQGGEVEEDGRTLIVTF